MLKFVSVHGRSVREIQNSESEQICRETWCGVVNSFLMKWHVSWEIRVEWEYIKKDHEGGCQKKMKELIKSSDVRKTTECLRAKWNPK
jgi:hypothetical protein